MTATSGRPPPRLPAPLLALYDLVFLLFLLCAAPWFLWRSRRDPRLRASWRARLGGGERREGDARCLWIHAVSVGEVRLSRALVAALAQARPDLPIAVSSTTTSGLELARALHPGRFVFQFPLDASFAVRRTFARVRPAALVLVELELWPNLLARARRDGVPVAVVNARVSERSFGRYRRLEPLLPQFAQVSLWLAQDGSHAARLRDLGVADERIVVTGNLKHDALRTELDPVRAARLRAECGLPADAPVLVGGSTHPGEEELLIGLLPRLRRAAPALRLVLAPRHLERSDEVAALAARAGLGVRRRSMKTGPTPPGAAPGVARGAGPAAAPDGGRGADLVLVDTLGELDAFYELADVVFVGGSLVPRGGQNMLEPAALGRATLFGPGTANFRREVELLRSGRGAIEVADGEELCRELARLLGDPEARRDLGERGRAVVSGLRGATARTAAEILSWQGRR